MYRAEPEYRSLKRWHEEWVLPLIDCMSLGSISWESIIDLLAQFEQERASELQGFYDLCLKYNTIARAASV